MDSLFLQCFEHNAYAGTAGLALVRVAVIMALLLLAGCTQSAEPGNEAVTFQDAGQALEGVVVDPAIAPVAGANVTHLASDVIVATDENGLFLFPSVSPGVHRLRIEAAGFETVELDAFVPANDTALPVRVELTYTIVGQPRSELVQWDGVIQCSVRHPQNALALCALLGVVGDDSQQAYGLPVLPDRVQSEMTWESTQSLGERLKVMYTDDFGGTTDNYADATGVSPLMVRADQRLLELKHIPENGLQIRVFGGDFQETGIGLTVQQRFAVFTSFYYDYMPPDDWRFTEAGSLHPPP